MRLMLVYIYTNGGGVHPLSSIQMPLTDKHILVLHIHTYNEVSYTKERFVFLFFIL